MGVRRVLLLIAAGSLLLAGCASAAHQPARERAGGSASSAAHLLRATTTVRSFAPYDSSGHLVKPVARRVSGHCWETSLAAPTNGTYRCLAGNTILDPCFHAANASRAKGTTLACFTDPWSKATVLTLTQRLPRSTPLPARPWAVVLGTGVRCVASTGTAPFVHGVGLGYACDNGTAAALRDTGSAHVHALVGRTGDHRLARTAVTTLWRG